jgi:Tfp pilus assembly protein PilF
VSLLAQKRAREAVAPLSEAARDTTDPIIETQLAAALRETGRAAEALTWLERATSRQPAFVAAFHELGIVLCSMRRFADAQAALERGSRSPTAAELSVELGGVFINRADPANAKIAFARALAQMPGHPRAARLRDGAAVRGRIRAGGRALPAGSGAQSRTRARAARPRSLPVGARAI